MRVFKYRGGSTELLRRDLRSLAKSLIFSAPIKSLNDPLEALVEVNHESFKIGRALSMLRLKRPTEAVNQLDNKLITQINSFFKNTDSYGVYSLSKTPTDELLWAYYADSHRGFCIEYDLDTLLEYKIPTEKILTVQYKSNIPVITSNDIFKSNEAGTLTKFLGTKSKKWEHEQEIRIVTGVNGFIEYDYRAVKAIYFGYRCDVKFQKLVMRVMAGRSISYFQIEPINNTYSLQAKPIPDVFEYFRNYRKRIAPIEEGAPNFDAITEPHRNLILKAVEIVRRDPYCELILDTYISNSKGTLSNPVFYVTYERSDGVTKNYFISKSEIESTDISS